MIFLFHQGNGYKSIPRPARKSKCRQMASDKSQYKDTFLPYSIQNNGNRFIINEMKLNRYKKADTRMSIRFRKKDGKFRLSGTWEILMQPVADRFRRGIGRC